MMDRDTSSARDLSALKRRTQRPQSSHIRPEKMLPWCPKFRDLTGWLPPIAPSDLAPSEHNTTKKPCWTGDNRGCTWPSPLMHSQQKFNPIEVRLRSHCKCELHIKRCQSLDEQLSPGESITLLCWGRGSQPDLWWESKEPWCYYFKCHNKHA